jgi:monoamine oxidase
MADAEVFDTVIVGAGAAGLVAAAELSRHRDAVCVLEARDRLGGRIFTRREPGVAAPIELGAEFIHGRSPATLGWLAKSNTAVIDVVGQRWTVRDGKPDLDDDLFARTMRGLSRIRRPRKDLPFSEFLEHVASRKLSPRERALARRLSRASTPPTQPASARWQHSTNGAATAPRTHRHSARSAAMRR